MSTPVLDAYALISGGVVALRAALADGLPGAEVTEVVRTHHRVAEQLDSVGLDVLNEAVAEDVPHLSGAVSPEAWLAGLVKMSPYTAVDRTRTAAALHTVCLATKTAFAAGDIALEQASAIGGIMIDLPKGATPEQIAQAERFLLDRAPASNALQLKALRKRVDDLIDPEGLLERERTAQKKRGLSIKDNHDGTQTVRWTDADDRMAEFKAALNSLAAPRPAADGTRDDRTPGQRRADAMADFVERGLRFCDLPTVRGMRAHVLITVSEENLRNGSGFGVTTTGETLTVATIMKKACDALITPLLIDGNGVPLKLGRTRRLASPAQWIALIVRDGGCVGPGCTRPPEWTDVHHIDWWEDLGPTDLENLCLLCEHHHDLVHHHGWTVIMAADGHPELVPPAHVDPFRWPIRNMHWHNQRGGQPRRQRTAA